jgi:hypothetical protein
MVDREVQDILEEIRERVRAGEAHVPDAGMSPLPPAPISLDNRFAGLSTMDRAWDRFPPLVSNRSGATARLELWIKSIIKRSLRWITWEQVNFNAAVKHTLREVVDSLVTYEQQLKQYEQTLQAKLDSTLTNDQLIRNELIAEIQHRREAIAANQHELRSLRDEVTKHRQEITDIAETQLLELVARCEGLQTQRNEVANELNALTARIATLESQNQVLRDTLNAQLTAYDASRQETQDKVVALIAELRDRDDRLLQEQRVCFKQLSLETSEAALLKDRAYRELSERLTRLETD